MKVIINQLVLIDGDKIPNTWSKTYESNVIPRIGDTIESSLWKNPGDYKVTGVTINYDADECYVGVERYANVIPSDRKEEYENIAALHGWKANWMR